MNKMPDRIWATPYDSDMDGGTYCDAAERPTSPNHDAWCYVRADIVQELTAERDRLRATLEDIADHDTGATAGLAYTAKIALKGETP